MAFVPISRCGRRILILGFALAVLVLRRPDAVLYPQFWAEDFAFLLDAERIGLASFWMPRAGYLHFFPRLIAWPGMYLDPVLQPAWFVGSAVAVTLAVVATCLSPRIPLPAKPWLALAVVVVPHSGEVFLNPTNLQWLTALALILTALKT